MAYQKQTWRDYDDNKTEVVNMNQGAVVTPERLNHMETGIANSADKAEVTAQLQHKAEKGNISVVDINKNLGKFDQTYMTDEFIAQFVENTQPINSVPAKGSITTEKTAFFKPHKNLFNPSDEDVLIGSRYNGTNTLVTDETVFQTGFIPVLEGDEITATYTKYPVNWYDADKNFISSASSLDFDANKYVVVPTGAIYTRVTGLMTDFDTFQVEKGRLLSNYEPYTPILENNYLKDIKSENIALEGIQTLNYAPKSITAEKTNFIEPSTNLFDKTKVKMGEYIGISGKISASEQHALSDFIEVSPNTNYVFAHTPYAACYFTADKVYISGNMTLTSLSPSNARFIRFGVEISKLDSQQLSVGTTLPPYEPYYEGRVKDGYVHSSSLKNKVVTLNKLSDDVLTTFGDTINNQALLQHLENPHIKTKIALFGDSITHGSGATGYSQDGELIAGTGTFGTRYRDNFDSLSWANEFRRWLNEHFNKNVYVYPLKDKNVIKTNGVVAYEDIYIKMGTNQIDNIEFDFYGTFIDIKYVKNTDLGKFDVYIDDVLKTSIDSYATAKEEAVFSVTGLSDAKHTIKIASKNTKNASSTGNSVIIRHCLVRKYVELDNLGCGGYGGAGIYTVLKANLTANDNFVFIMSGTNDRGQTSPEFTYSYLNLMVDYIQSNSPETIITLMSANAVTGEYSNSAYKYYQADVDMITRKVAKERNLQHISHFDEYWRQVEMRGIPLSQLLADGLHPSDEGHYLIFKTLLRNTGLAIKNVVR